MRNIFLFLFSVLVLAPATSVNASPVGVTTADAHGPIGVMGDHAHHPGEWMLSYRFMRMDMEGNRDGKTDLSAGEVLGQGFMATPLKMSTDMHMFGVMYGVTERVTLMVMLPYIEKDMDHVNRMAVNFSTESSGVGDLKVSGLIRLVDRPHQKIHVTSGFSVPTGSINQKDTIPTPMGLQKVRLPYPMQIGSGTLDYLGGITYSGKQALWSWGAQASSVIRLDDENSHGYSLGDVGTLTAWGAREFNRNVSASLRLVATKWGNIDGADPMLNPDMVPTADPNRRAGERLDIGLGVNLLGVQGAVAGQRLALEWLQPVEQDLDGPQLKSDGMLILGWQYAWH